MKTHKLDLAQSRRNGVDISLCGEIKRTHNDIKISSRNDFTCGRCARVKSFREFLKPKPQRSEVKL